MVRLPAGCGQHSRPTKGSGDFVNRSQVLGLGDTAWLFTDVADCEHKVAVRSDQLDPRRNSFGYQAQLSSQRAALPVSDAHNVRSVHGLNRRLTRFEGALMPLAAGSRSNLVSQKRRRACLMAVNVSRAGKAHARNRDYEPGRHLIELIDQAVFDPAALNARCSSARRHPRKVHRGRQRPNGMAPNARNVSSASGRPLMVERSELMESLPMVAQERPKGSSGIVKPRGWAGQGPSGRRASFAASGQPEPAIENLALLTFYSIVALGWYQ